MRNNEKRHDVDKPNVADYKNEYDPNMFLIPQNDEMVGSGAQNIKLKKRDEKTTERE